MIVWLLIILIVFLLGKGKFLKISSFLLLLILMSFRELNVGTDTINYFGYFEYVKGGGILWTEPLWQIVNKIAVLFDNYYYVLFISSLLVLVPIFIVFNRVNINFKLGIVVFILLYYYFQGFNIMRQSISVSILLLSYYYLSKNNLKLFLLWVLIACSFHKTAFLGATAILLLSSKFERNVYVYQVISIIIGIVLSSYLLSFFIMLYPNYAVFSLKEDRLSVLINIVLLNSFLVYFRAICQKSFWLNIFSLYVISYNLFCLFPYSDRLNMVLGISQVVFFPIALKTLKDKKYWLLTLMLILTYSSLYFALNFMKNAANIFPYNNILLTNDFSNW